MPHTRRTLLAAALCCLAAALPLRAQRAADPSGHWEGTLHAPSMEVPFAVDLARNADGVFAGTLNLPAEKIKGLPLLKVSVDAADVSFFARADQPLRGTMSADGSTITGDFSAGGNTVPFSLTHTGDAAVAPEPTSPKVSAAIEGRWNATIAASGLDVHVVLTLANRADNKAVAHLVNLDQGGLRLPFVVAQDGAVVTLTSTVVPSSFTGTIGAAGDLAGTFTQGTLSVPVTFHRAGDR